MTAAREWVLDGHAGRLAGRTWDGATPPTHVVLLAHGYGEHSGRYDHVAAALVAGGASVHAVDHVGHGKSAGDRLVPPDGSRVGVEHLRGESSVERLYPGAQHEIFNETNRDEVLADVVAFVRDALRR